MLFLVTTRPVKPAPPELFAAVPRALAGIQELERQGVVKFAGVFVQGGVCLVVDAPSHDELNRAILSTPTFPYAEFEVRPLVTVAVALENVRRAQEARAQA